jgi:Rieske Fe-S protein
MMISRRDFLLLSVGLAAGCKTDSKPVVTPERAVNVGPASNFAADGVYTGFQSQGFFVVRKGDRLFALSSFCTHRKCRLSAEKDGSFYCKCHGSTFDPDGRVTRAPAKRDLPLLPIDTSDQQRVVVRVPGK